MEKMQKLNLRMQKLNLRMQKLNFPGTHWRGLALIGTQKQPLEWQLETDIQMWESFQQTHFNSSSKTFADFFDIHHR